MLLSLMLYGSRARGDHRLRSDVDLLGVIESGQIHKEIASRGASFYHYPAETLLKKSREGDLFTLHLVEEGKVLHDTLGFFQDLKSSFVYRESYLDQIKIAHAIVLFFSERPQILSTRNKKERKRLVWALRTILIARAAESRTPCFSSSSLMDFSKMPDIKRVIDGRSTIAESELISLSKNVAREFGYSTLNVHWPKAKPAQRAYLKALGGIAEDTLRFVKLLPKRPGPLAETLPDYPL